MPMPDKPLMLGRLILWMILSLIFCPFLTFIFLKVLFSSIYVMPLPVFVPLSVNISRLKVSFFVLWPLHSVSIRRLSFLYWNLLVYLACTSKSISVSFSGTGMSNDTVSAFVHPSVLTSSKW